MTVWMLYAVAVSLVLGAAAWLAHKALAWHRRPTRGLWFLSLVAGAALPVVMALVARPASLAGHPAPALFSGEVLWLAPLDAVERAGLPSRSLDTALLVLWLASSLILLAWLGWSFARLRRDRATWTPAVLDGGTVFVSPDVGPAVVDPLDGAIVVPPWLLGAEADTRRLVLAHERSHVAAGDARLVWSAMIVLSLLPWNPVLWWHLRRLRWAVELDCDQRVLAGGAEPRPYAELLLRLAGGPDMSPLHSTLLEPAKVLERRIIAMLAPRQPARPVRAALAGALALGLVALAGALPVPAGLSRPEAVRDVAQPIPPSIPGPALAASTDTQSRVHAEPSAPPHKTSTTRGSARAPAAEVAPEPREAGPAPEGNRIMVQCSTHCIVTASPFRMPLFVVDDVELSTVPDVPSLQVESIGVVTGEEARARYGDRGRNGVIRIVTKRS